MGRKINTARAAKRSGATQLYLVENDATLDQTRRRKTWSQRDCKDVTPLTDRQREAFQCWFQRTDSHLALLGSAGVGKSYLGCFLGINEVLNPKTEQKRLIIVRSAVETRAQGFLPGTLEEKEQVYKLPYVDIFQDLFGRAATFEDMCESGIVKFMTTSHVRGLTFDNAIILIDESQNLTKHEINSIVTRVGRGSRIIFLGDGYQNDLHSKKGTEVSGFDYAVAMMSKIESFDLIKFTHDDICRSEFVKQWIIQSERYM